MFVHRQPADHSPHDVLAPAVAALALLRHLLTLGPNAPRVLEVEVQSGLYYLLESIEQTIETVARHTRWEDTP